MKKTQSTRQYGTEIYKLGLSCCKCGSECLYKSPSHENAVKCAYCGLNMSLPTEETKNEKMHTNGLQRNMQRLPLC